MVHLPEKVATRLPIRKDSFADLEDQDTTSMKVQESPPPSPSYSLIQENELLRRQLEELQAQFTLLRDYHHQNQNQHQQKATPGVLLELPRAMKTPRLYALNCLRKNSSKDHQSSVTEDDQSTIEPSMDVDVYESGGGLKHRQGLPKPKRRLMVSSPATNTSTRKTEPLSSNDGSLSSEEDGDDDDDDDDDGKNDDRGLHRNNDDDDDDDGDDFDDQGDGIDVESRQLLRVSQETRTMITTNTSSTGSAEEEPFWRSVSDRAGWLVGLLILQSMSSFILARNEALLQKHLVIIRFLTMLVGAGGNAGNQASVRVIRGLAVGTIHNANAKRVLRREFFMGCALSLVLGVAGCIRAAVFMTPWLETIAITTSLFMIVIISIILGAMMPLGMKFIGIDPAHSSTTIQVVMDILGVSITVWMSALVLDSGFQHFLLSSFMDAR